MSKDSAPLTILSFEAEAIRGIKVAEIEPSGNVIQITGKNGQGKTSLIDAIEWTLTGKITGADGKTRKPKEPPIYRGRKLARGTADLGPYIVERVVEEGKRERLKVKSPGGAEYPQAQTKISDIVGPLAFDPLAFDRMGPAAQRELLLRLAGVDLTSLADARVTLYQARRDVNRDHKQALARVGERVKGAPKEPVDLGAVREEVAAAMTANHQNEMSRQKARQSTEKEALEERFLEEAGQEVARLRNLVEDAERREGEQRRALLAARKVAREDSANAEELRDADLAPIRQKLADGKAANELHAAHVARLQRKREVKSLAEKSEKLTGKIADIDKKKVAMLERAEFPIAGLAVSDDGVTFNGFPLDQEATSDRIRVSTSIAAAMNPKLSVALVREGDKLDPDSFRAFAEHCAEIGLQAWVERISPVGDGAIVIEAGEVKS